MLVDENDGYDCASCGEFFPDHPYNVSTPNMNDGISDCFCQSCHERLLEKWRLLRLIEPGSPTAYMERE